MSHHPKLTGRQVRIIAKVFTLTDRANDRQRKAQSLNSDTLLHLLNTLNDVMLELLGIDDLDRIETVKHALESKEHLKRK